MKRPLFSIITAVKNNKDMLERTIRSVLAQDFSDHEFIVIDGGSGDGTRELLKKYADKIAYSCSEPDNGIAHAFNKGLTAAKGEYIQILNAGDIYKDENVLKRVSEDIEGSDKKIFTGISKVKGKNARLPLEDRSNSDDLAVKAHLSHQATFVSRDVFHRYGMFSECFRISMDYDFFLRVLKRERFEWIDKELVLYDGGASADIDNWYTLKMEDLLAGFLNRENRWCNFEMLYQPVILLIKSRLVKLYKKLFVKNG